MKMKTLNVERTVSAPLKSVWQLVSDVGGYAKYAPNIDSSKVVSGKGAGLVRECASKEGRWNEVCTAWRDNESYEFDIQTQAEDYPFPFKTLRGKWSVESVNEGETTIYMKFDVDFKNKVVGWFIFPIMKIQLLKVCDRLLENWETALKV